MRRKPPLNLDIDEKALLDEIDGQDFVSLVEKRKLEKIKKEENNTQSVINDPVIQEEKKTEILKINKTEKVKSKGKDRDEDFIDIYLKADFDIDYTNRRRMDVDVRIHDKIKKIVSCLNMSLEDGESALFVRDYINRVLLVHLSEWENIGERIYNIRTKNRKDD